MKRKKNSLTPLTNAVNALTSTSNTRTGSNSSNPTLSNGNGNVNQQYSAGLESAEAQDTIENKIYNSISMSEARRMLEKIWNQYKDCLQKDNWDTMQLSYQIAIRSAYGKD